KIINEALIEASLNPISIKHLNIQKKRYDDHCVYLVTFLKSDKISIIDLQEIQAINQIRITWQSYRYSRNGPTQCSNCLRFGHGTANCHLAPRCIRCAGDHKSKECPLIQVKDGNPLTKITTSKLKCALCGGNHTANFSKCTKRIEFVKSRSTWTKQTIKRNPIVKFQTAPQLEGFQFPSLPNSQGPAWTKSSYASAFPEAKHANARGYSQTQSNPNDLYSHEELFSIFLDITSQLAKAKSKQEQIQIMMSVAIKYAVPYNG
ncbi:putative Nucleic-acid-binding protein from transposon X-element, partial [Polypedilum vanderplanki]